LKLDVQRQLAGILYSLLLCLTLAAVWSAPINVLGQANNQTSKILLPPRSTLAPVHLPDLSQLENEVRDQLENLQDSLASLLRDSNSNDEKLSEAYGGLGESYHAYSLNAPARECYENAHRLAPKDFRWIYLMAKLDQQEGRVDDAISRYRSAAELHPDYVAVHVNLGNIYLELNRLEDARKSFAAALAIQKEIPAAYYGLGQLALSRRNFSEAVEHFDKALSLAPEANRIHYSLAMAYRGLKEPEKARTHLAQQGVVGVRVADPLVDRLQGLVQSERVFLIRGRAALEAKRYTEAAEEFRKAVAANPKSVPALVNLGAALTQTGDLKGAAEQFERTLQIDPNNTNAHYNLGVLLANENKHGPAINHLQAVSRINPNDLGARFLLAQELMKLSRDAEALEQFAQIVQSDPNNEAALLELARLLQKTGRHQEALDALEKGHARHPQKGQTVVMLAYVLAASPQFDLRNGTRALKLAQLAYGATGSVEHGALVGLALAELGRCGEAAEWQRKMIAAAERQRNEVMVAKLKTQLERSEKGSSCRPAGDIR